MNPKKESNLQTKPHKSEIDNQLDELLPEMPEALKSPLVNMLDSPEYANQNLKADFLASLQSFEMLTQKDSAVKSFLPEGTNQESLAKALSKVDDSQSILETEQLEGAAVFNALFESIAEDPLDDIQEIRRFANASNLYEAFGEEEGSEALAFLNVIPQDSAELLHAAIACKIAGMPKQANLLFQIFAKRQFVDANERYQSLQTDITKFKGYAEASSKAGKAGRDKRYATKDKVEAFAIQFYTQKNYANPHQAAQAMVNHVMEYAKSVDYAFTSSYQAIRTINSWLSKHIKSTK
ncbi:MULTISPECIES: hypothetical protein [Pseudomonadati]|uniref:YopN family type III secretion system gatekeeper subunit n=1 Tax=Shewanella aestuarii TaxID=1028752 RepID=A0ABT0L213_9GAMM|nr:hypothetical protein [Shewanella aestuarii]MCL1117720.1 hypothetical protein [Shewanella aestuarii]GGN76624.1 hypothetical protein GCM10009193_18140 [Shewanella aestuarii]